MIYCVVPEELAPELYDRLAAYYADDGNVQVIIDRRRGERRERHPSGDAGVQQRMQRAIDVFNASDHTRTVGGVARSLGPPAVAVRPLTDRPSVVAITVMWELSWYRYEVDLSDEAGGVRRDAQGDELSELSEAEQAVNAAADERGALHLS